ncbi:MAG: hypothetical protein QXI33_01295 [Candidatus Pacearchaeota archaeon]
MKIRVKKSNNDGLVRLESGGEIKEILINEDFLHPKQESISLCFRGKDSSGIIDLSSEEIERLYNTINQKKHLIKGLKVMKFEKN